MVKSWGHTRDGERGGGHTALAEVGSVPGAVDLAAARADGSVLAGHVDGLAGGGLGPVALLVGGAV